MTDYLNHITELMDNASKKAFENKEFESMLCKYCIAQDIKCKAFRKLWKKYKSTTYEEDKAEDLFDSLSEKLESSDDKAKLSIVYSSLITSLLLKYKKEEEASDEDFLEQQMCHTFEKYLKMKKHYEEVEGWCKINSPAMYGKIRNTDEGKIFENEQNPQTFFKNKNYTIEVEKNGKKTEYIYNFFQSWEKDPAIKTYDRIVFDPKKLNPKDLNLFSEYCNILDSKNRKIVALDRFFEHAKSICGYDLLCFEYMLNYFAHIIQKASTHCDVAVVMYGDEGIGKNMLLNLIGRIIGLQYYSESSCPEDIFGKHAIGMYRKMMFVYDESDINDTKGFMGRLKTLVSGRKLRVELKHKDMIEVDNYCRLFFPTNNRQPFPMTKNGRRWFYVKGSSKYIEQPNRHEHFESLGNHFEDLDLVYSLAKFLLERDISNFNPNRFPKSEGLKQAIQVPLIVRCIHSTIISKDEQCDRKFSATKIKDIVLKYCKENNYTSTAYNLTSIGNELKEYITKKIVFKGRDDEGVKYTFDKEAFIKYVKECNYDLEELDDNEEVEEKTTLEQMLDEVKDLKERARQKYQRYLKQCDKQIKANPLDNGVDLKQDLKVVIEVTPVKEPKETVKSSNLDKHKDKFIMSFD